jgi:Ca2+-binding RTX toxin-like protein
MGDLLHNGPNALIKAWSNKKLIAFHNCSVCLQTVDRPVLFMAKKSSTKKLKTTVLRSSKGAKLSNSLDVLVHYQGFLNNGEEFDASYNFTTFEVIEGKTPFDFQLGAGEVIQGWDKGLVGRRLGEVIELKIPADLAYGSAGAGDRIPPDSPLTFKIEVLAAAAPEDQQWTAGTFKDIGVNTKKLGLTNSMLELIEQNKVGLNGNDALIGGDQTDLLIGLKGNDRLVGNRGGDVLIGGKGKNKFVYAAIKDSPNRNGEQDQILGFGKKDKLDLSGFNQKLRFIGSDGFKGTAGDVRFKKETLQMDHDGDGSADFAVLMSGVNSLKGSNLIL